MFAISIGGQDVSGASPSIKNFDGWECGKREIRTFFAGCLVHRRHIVSSAVRVPCVLKGRVRLVLICGVKRSGLLEQRVSDDAGEWLIA